MRILYGVHGYGRGHATRALALLPRLAGHHQIQVVAGGDAYSAIWPDYRVIRIPTLGFAYGRNSRRRSNWQTFRRNISAVLDLALQGPVFDMVRDMMREFSPDVVISDAEAWTHHVAHSLGIPRISIDHIGIMAHCRPKFDWTDRLEAILDTALYKLLVKRPERVIVSSFYDAPPRRAGVCVVGTLPRQLIRDLKPTCGEHLLAYFNRGQDQLTPPMLHALDAVGCPVHVYGTTNRGWQGRLNFLPHSNLPFLEDLAGCRAVVSTAGNQLMGEAIFLGKPVLVMPERCVEQRLNAAAVKRLGVGERVTPRGFTADRIKAFLNRADQYVVNIHDLARDGLEEALAAIERYLTELAPRVAERAITMS